MILREKVTIGFDGGRDEDGGWIPPRNANYLAEVEAVSAEESAALGREPSSLTYKVLLPRMRTGDTLTASSTITWRGTRHRRRDPATHRPERVAHAPGGRFGPRPTPVGGAGDDSRLAPGVGAAG